MSTVLLASRLLATAIAQKLPTVRLGLKADSLPPIDPEEFIKTLNGELSETVRIGLLGYDNLLSDGETVTTQVEQVVAWRNAPSLPSIKIVVVLNPEHVQEKTHSLHMLEPFNDTDLQKAIYKIGLETASSELAKALWGELARKATQRRLQLVAGQLIRFFALLEAGEKVENVLFALRLLPDNALAVHIEDLQRRLEKNRENVKWLDGLDAQAQRELSRALANGSKRNSKTFRNVKLYRYNPTLENLKALDLDAVLALRHAPKQQKKPVRNKRLTSPTVGLIENFLLSIEKDDPGHFIEQLQQQLEALSSLFTEEISPDYEEDVQRVQAREASLAEGREAAQFIDPETHEEAEWEWPSKKEERHPLEDFLYLWVHNDCWGGLLTLEETPDSINDAFDLITNDQLQPTFTPYFAGNLRNTFIEMEKEAGESSGTPLQEIFDEMKMARSALIAVRYQFLYYPLEANLSVSFAEKIDRYLVAYQRLSKRLQAISHRIQANAPLTIDFATANFLRLDTIIVQLVSEEGHVQHNVILSPLHPLHLWKWHQLAMAILENDALFDETAQNKVLSAVQSLPTLLNTFVLHDAMFEDSQRVIDDQLVFAGPILNPKNDKTVGIPYYRPLTTSSPSSDGLNEFAAYLRQFLVMYPYARIGLTLVLIDPPSIVAPILNVLYNLHKEIDDSELPLLMGATVIVYHRQNSLEAYDVWDDRDELAIQLFRENPRWRLRVPVEKMMSYQAILNHLQRANRYPHIILTCDPSETIMVTTDRRMTQTVTPFSVPEQVTYDPIADTIKIEPFPNGELFNDYFGVRHILSGESYQKVHAVGSKTSKEGIQQLIEHDHSGRWLAIIDHPQGTLQLPHLGKRLLHRQASGRTLALHTREADWDKLWLDELTKQINALNLGIEPNIPQLLSQMLELFPVLPDGLLTLIHKKLDEKRFSIIDKDALCQLLGIIAVLNWYRQDKPGLVLLQIDDTFNDWYVNEEIATKAKSDIPAFLALWLQDEKLHADILTLDAQLVDFYGVRSLVKKDAATKQQLRFANTLYNLFVVRDRLITPLRQTLLHRRLVQAVFTAAASNNQLLQQTKATKRTWEQKINNLFAGEPPNIRVAAIGIALCEHRQKLHSLQNYSSTDPRFAHFSVTLPAYYLHPQQNVQTIDNDGNQPNADTSEPTSIETVEEGGSQTEPALNENLSEKTVTPKQESVQLKEEIKQQADALRRVLLAYGVSIAGVVIEKTQIGPRFVRYWVQLQPPAGRLSEMQKYANDIARELGSLTVPFIDNIPGETYVGVDLPRQQPETVPLADALAGLPVDQPYELMVAIGENVAGEMVTKDLAQLPHMLVAGHTGGGKSVFLSSLIMSLVWHHSAETLRLVLVDPKLMDFPLFEGLPHLHNQEVIYNPSEAIDILRWLIEKESQRRALVMRGASTRKIESYYRHHSKESLPRFVVIIDEFADIMNSLGRKEKEAFVQQINRLAATGRARGIHLVLATQRPTADIISGAIKTNFPARVSFQLPSQIDSRVILDQGGAENLLGKGDMLLSTNHKIERLQGYFASDEGLIQLLQQKGFAK